MNRVRWTRCFEPGCIQIRGEREPNEAKKRKESLKSKKKERKNIASRSETNCSFIGRAEADVEGGQEKGKAG